jgi:hypothetical protein
MSFLAPASNLPIGLSNPENEQGSSYKEAIPLPDVRGNGNIGLKWLCQNTTPELTPVGSTHHHYHANIAGLLNHGIIHHIGEVKIGGKVVANLAYSWNGSEEYHDFSIDTDGGHTTVPTLLRFYFGTETQTADSILNGFHEGQTHPAYRGQSYVVLQQLYGGDGSFRVPDVTIQFRAMAPFTHDATTYGDTEFSQGCNPINIIHRLVTHPRAGLGLDQDVVFDMDDLVLKYTAVNDQANATYGEAQRGYISPQFTKKRKAKEWIKELLTYLDGFMTLKNGKLDVDWFPNETIQILSPAQYATIYQSDIVENPDIDLPVWEDTISSVVIDYISIEKAGRQTSLTLTSQHGKAVLGVGKTENITRDWFSYANQVQSYGERYLSAKEAPTLSGKINVKRDRAKNPNNTNVPLSRRGLALLPGHLFNFNYAPYAILQLCRITEINPRGNVWEIKFVQERGTFASEYVVTPDAIPNLTEPTPDALDNWDVLNLPIALTGYNKNYVGVFAERFSKDITSWDITFNDSNTWGTEEAYLSEQVSFGAKFILSESVANEAGPTTFEIEGDTENVDLSDLMQSLSANEAENNTLLLFMNGEVMSLETIAVVSGASYNITGYRGRYNSTIASHSISDTGWIIRRADLVQWYHEKFDLVYAASVYDTGLATKYFKTNSNNFYGGGTWSESKSLLLSDQIPSLPTGLTLTPLVGRIKVEWTPITDADSKVTWIQRATDAGFTTAVVSIAVPPTGEYTILDLIPAQVYYIRIQSEDNTGNLSAWTTADSVIPLITAIDVPPFWGSRPIGGASDISFELNKNESGSLSYGTIRILGNVYVDTEGTRWPVYGPTTVRSPYRSGDIYPENYPFDDGPYPGREGTFYIAHIEHDANTYWSSGSWGGNQGYDFFIAIILVNQTWLAVDNEGDYWGLYGYEGATIVAKAERQPGSDGITGIISMMTPLEKPLELELVDTTIVAMKARDFTGIKTGAEVRVRGLSKMYYDADSVATADDLVVFNPTTPATGRVFLDGWTDMPKMVAPAAPATGWGRLYVDETDEQLYFRSSVGTFNLTWASIPLSFAPGQVGGSGDVVFTLNANTGGSYNRGEVRVQGSKLVLPDGVVKSPAADQAIFTNYGEGQAGKFFIMWSDTNPTTRFGGVNWGTSVNFFPCKVDAGVWKAIDNEGALYAITLLASDCLLAAVEAESTPGDLNRLQPFFSKEGLSVHVSTIYKRSATAPGTPTGGNYNFTTKTLTPPDTWFVSPPAGSDPLYSSVTTWSIVGTTGTDSVTTWTGGTILGEINALGNLSVNSNRIFTRTVDKTSLAAAPSTTYIFRLTGFSNYQGVEVKIVGQGLMENVGVATNTTFFHIANNNGTFYIVKHAEWQTGYGTARITYGASEVAANQIDFTVTIAGGAINSDVFSTITVTGANLTFTAL